MNNGANALSQVNRTSISKEAGLGGVGEVCAISRRYNFLVRRIGRGPVTNFRIEVLAYLASNLIYRDEYILTEWRTVGNPESGLMCLNASRVDRSAMLDVQIGPRTTSLNDPVN